MNDDKPSVGDLKETAIEGQETHVKVGLSRDIVVTHATDHSEISILESTWKDIKRKINQISVKKTFDGETLLSGVMLPYIIDLFCDLFNKRQINILPIAICFLLFAYRGIEPHISFLGKSKDAENQIHLDDLKEMIASIDATYEKEASKLK